jgi:hypothetical protein
LNACQASIAASNFQKRRPLLIRTHNETPSVAAMRLSNPDVKNDSSTPPADASAIQAVAPSDMFSWQGPDVRVTWQSGRTGIENKWFALTGRVVAVQVEADGDLHIELADATDPKPGIVVCEVPAGPTWCEIRKTIFSWTRTRFPLHIQSTRNSR